MRRVTTTRVSLHRNLRAGTNHTEPHTSQKSVESITHTKLSTSVPRLSIGSLIFSLEKIGNLFYQKGV